MVIDIDKVVTLSYQLFSVNEQKQLILIEERPVDDPLEFIYGQGVLIKAVEEKIKGQTFGFQAQMDLHPRDAFGLHHPELLIWIPKKQFPKDQELELGMKFQTQGPDGQIHSVIVKEVQEDQVLVDGNHPLAGLNIRFDINVLRVREATEKERLQKAVDPTLLQ